MSKLQFGARANLLAISAAAVALAGFTAFSPALAQGAGAKPEGMSGVSARINYSDLDLATKPGKAALRRRVWAAVHNMCRGDEVSYQPQLQDVKCRTSAWTQAAPQIELAVRRSSGVAAATSPAAASAITIGDPQ